MKLVAFIIVLATRLRDQAGTNCASLEFGRTAKYPRNCAFIPTNRANHATHRNTDKEKCLSGALPYREYLPTDRSSVAIFASPHSGRHYSPDFVRQSQLGMRELRSTEDAFVDDLFGCAPAFGAPLLCATMPRAFVDLNRGIEELDPVLHDGHLAAEPTTFVRTGLGVIPRVVRDGRAIYAGTLCRAEVEGRIGKYYRPYHSRLGALIEETHRIFGKVILFDCHSMPHDSIKSIRGKNGKIPEVVLGNRFGKACDRTIMDSVEEGV